MHRHFDEQLDILKMQLIKMSGMAETMIGDAIAILVDRDESRIPILLAKENVVNQMHKEIDEACLTLMALYQPAGEDVRFILGAVKTNSELERLADQAVNVSEKAAQLVQKKASIPHSQIEEMAQIVRVMVKDSLHAYVSGDSEKAKNVILRDDRLDELRSLVIEKMMSCIIKKPEIVQNAISVILMAQNLERIGDHTTNIAENTVFVAEGLDIRHSNPSKSDPSESALSKFPPET